MQHFGLPRTRVAQNRTAIIKLEQLQPTHSVFKWQLQTPCAGDWAAATAACLSTSVRAHLTATMPNVCAHAARSLASSPTQKVCKILPSRSPTALPTANSTSAPNSFKETARARVNVFSVMMEAAANPKPNNAQRPQTKPEPKTVAWICLSCQEMGESPAGRNAQRIPVCKCQDVAYTRYQVQDQQRQSGVYKASKQDN